MSEGKGELSRGWMAIDDWIDEECDEGGDDELVGETESGVDGTRMLEPRIFR